MTVWSWCNTKRIQSDFGLDCWYCGIYPHCAYIELQNKMKWKIVSLQTFQCMCWQSIRNMNTNKGILNISKHHSWKEKTSIPNVVTGIRIHTANPNCVYCVQSISLAQSSGKGGGFQNKKWTHTHTYQFQNSFALLLLLIVHEPYMLMTANTLPLEFHLIGAHTHVPTWI